VGTKVPVVVSEPVGFGVRVMVEKEVTEGVCVISAVTEGVTVADFVIVGVLV
jgi:hypothetical protein